MTKKGTDIAATVLATANPDTGMYDLEVDGPSYIGTVDHPFRCASTIPSGPVGKHSKPLTIKQVTSRINALFPGARVRMEGRIE